MTVIRRIGGILIAGVLLMAIASSGVGIASAQSTSTVNPLRYACEINAATCEGVGTTQGYYDGENVEFLYTGNYFCDTSVPSGASSGCEAGADANKLPPGVSSRQFVDPLYIPVPLFKPAPSYTQCPSSPGCIDHPMTIDLSRLATALGAPASSLKNVPVPSHNHIVTTTNDYQPEWWPIVVVGVKSASSWTSINSAKDYAEVQKLQANKNSGVTADIPTNAYLFFQVLPGQLTSGVGVTSNAAPPGPAPSGGSGTTIDNLNQNCTDATPGQCENIGLTQDWIDGTTVDALYTQTYFCDKSVSSGASSGCEAGATYKDLPPGVSSSQFVDPLYIPVPLFSQAPAAIQCPSTGCIDHPMTIDLSRLAAALGKPAADLMNVPVPAHDHVLTTRNGDQPEWWPVVVVGVTNPTSFADIENAQSYSEVQALQANTASGVTADIPTNLFLFFGTLPGTIPVSEQTVQHVTTSSTTPPQMVVPAGAPSTGGGSTAGFQNGPLFGTGLGLAGLGLALGLVTIRRRRHLVGAGSGDLAQNHS